MVLAITVNVVLAAIVFTAIFVLLMRAIRASDAAAPAASLRLRPARARRRAFAPARPWA